MSEAAIAAFAARLSKAGTDLPVASLQAGAKAAAAHAGITAARGRRGMVVRLTQTARGAVITLTGPGAVEGARAVRVEMARRIPEIRKQVAADIRAKIRQG